MAPQTAEQLTGSDSASISSLLGPSLHQKYRPFSRNDIYGVIGEGSLRPADKVRLYLGIVFLLPLRAVLSLLFILVFFITCWVTSLVQPPVNVALKRGQGVSSVVRSIHLRVGAFCARSILFILGFYYVHKESKGDGGTETVGRASLKPAAIVSNHISWLDILYHMSDTLPSFVAKSGTAKAPLVGLISQCMGCIYVERENKATGQAGAAGALMERMKAVEQNSTIAPVLIFPEGTTTNGDYLLPFRTGAFLAGAPVQPVILKYPHQRFNPSWESIEFSRHVVLSMSQLVNHLEVQQLPVYVPSEEEKKDPHLYANNVRNLMAKEAGLTLSSMTLYDKRCYHAILRGQPLPEPSLTSKKGI